MFPYLSQAPTPSLPAACFCTAACSGGAMVLDWAVNHSISSSLFSPTFPAWFCPTQDGSAWESRTIAPPQEGAVAAKSLRAAALGQVIWSQWWSAVCAQIQECTEGIARSRARQQIKARSIIKGKEQELMPCPHTTESWLDWGDHSETSALYSLMDRVWLLGSEDRTMNNHMCTGFSAP